MPLKPTKARPTTPRPINPLESILKFTFSKISASLFLATAFVFSGGAHAQDAKRDLALKLAQLQAKIDQAGIVEQMTASAVQPLIAGWSMRLDEAVPPAKQKEVRDKLDVELKKFADSTQKAIEAQAPKAAEAAFVPLFMEKLTEDEMRTIIAYLESPVSAKFQDLGAAAGSAWVEKIVESTRASVEGSAKTFEAAAERIVSSASAPAKSGGGSAPAKK